MPFEKICRVLLWHRYWTLLLWAALETAILFSLISYFEVMTPAQTLSRYGSLIVTVVAALNFDVLFVLSTWDLTRASEGRISALLRNPHATNMKRLFAGTVFSKRLLFLTTSTTIALGLVTFAVVGVGFSSQVLVALSFALIPVVFGSLGYTLATAFGTWRAVWRLSSLQLDISPFHPDRVGGTKPIGDLAIRVFGFGSLLVPVWALGAHLAPYGRIDLRVYGYLWVLVAVLLLIYSLFGPAFNLHKALAAAKASRALELSAAFDTVYDSISSRISNNIAKTDERPWVVLSGLQVLEDKVTDMQVWPYPDLRKVAAGATVQLITLAATAFVSNVEWMRIAAKWIRGTP